MHLLDQAQAIAQRVTNADGSTTMVPIGNYMAKIIEAYRDSFVGKNYRKQPRKRRDIGIARDPEKLKKARIEDGRPQPEAEFLRDRSSDSIANPTLIFLGGRGPAGRLCPLFLSELNFAVPASN